MGLSGYQNAFQIKVTFQSPQNPCEVRRTTQNTLTVKIWHLAPICKLAASTTKGVKYPYLEKTKRRRPPLKNTASVVFTSMDRCK